MRDMSSESAADVAADVVEECVAHDERAEHFERVEAIQGRSDTGVDKKPT